MKLFDLLQSELVNHPQNMAIVCGVLLIIGLAYLTWVVCSSPRTPVPDAQIRVGFTASEVSKLHGHPEWLKLKNIEWEVVEMDYPLTLSPPTARMTVDTVSEQEPFVPAPVFHAKKETQVPDGSWAFSKR